MEAFKQCYDYSMKQAGHSMGRFRRERVPGDKAKYSRLKVNCGIVMTGEGRGSPEGRAKLPSEYDLTAWR